MSASEIGGVYGAYESTARCTYPVSLVSRYAKLYYAVSADIFSHLNILRTQTNNFAVFTSEFWRLPVINY